MIRVITYFGGSFLPLRQSKALYKVGFFEEITGDLQKKAEFATRIINTSALPCVYMLSIKQFGQKILRFAFELISTL